MAEPGRAVVEVVSAHLASQYPLNLAATDYVGRGLGSMVFRARGGANVLKFERHPFGETVVAAIAELCSIDEANRRLEPEREELAARWRARYAALDDHFAGHVVPTQIALTSVMVSGEVLLGAAEARGLGVVAENTYALTTYLRRQPYTAVATDESRLSLHGAHAELARGLDPEAYVAMSRQLLPEPDQAVDVDFSTFAAVHSAEPVSSDYADCHRGLLRMIPLLSQDSDLRDSVVDFLGRAHQFVTDHDEPIDIMGEDNVVFFRHDGRWDYLLLDPLTAVPAPWRENLQTVARLREDGYLSLGRAAQLEFALNVTRAHNMAAHAAGVPELRLDLPVGAGPQSPVQWRSLLHAIQEAFGVRRGTDWHVPRPGRSRAEAPRRTEAPRSAAGRDRRRAELAEVARRLRALRTTASGELTRLEAQSDAALTQLQAQVGALAGASASSAASTDASRSAWSAARAAIDAAIASELAALEDARS